MNVAATPSQPHDWNRNRQQPAIERLFAAVNQQAYLPVRRAGRTTAQEGR